MSRLPRVRGKQVLAALRQAGFEIIRIRGSHHFLRHPDGRATVVAVHSGEHIGPGCWARFRRLRNDAGGICAVLCPVRPVAVPLLLW